MKPIVYVLATFISTFFRTRVAMQLEIAVLRHELAVYQRGTKRPRARAGDRMLWYWVARVWSGWQTALYFVQPRTVTAWQRERFRDYWTRMRRHGKTGRPPIPKQVVDLIRKMSKANPTWGSPRIVGELHWLGIEVAKSTIEKYRIRSRKPPSPTWKTFLNNHVKDLVAIDFFTVPTVRFKVLFVLVVLAHHRRRVVHFNVTERPTAQWTAQQMVEALPWDTAPQYVPRDRDAIYGEHFQRRVKSFGIEEVVTAPRSPWQNPFVERLIGSVRGDCLDHVIVFDERPLKRILSCCFDYCHRWQTHRALAMDSRESRPVQPPAQGNVIEFTHVSDLQHHYGRLAA